MSLTVPVLHEKSISTVPVSKTPSTLYYVRNGAGFDLYLTDATGTVAHALNSSGGSSGGLPETWETLSKNLRAYPSATTWVNGKLTTITYTTPSGSIEKKLNYDTNGVLVNIVLSGAALPITTKTLAYNLDGTFAGATYS